MNVFAWIVLSIIVLCTVIAIIYFYIESGKEAVECVNEFKIPEKWKVLVRTLVFIFNPLILAVFIIIGILILLLDALKGFIESIYGMDGWLRSTYKEVKELITK